MAASSKAKADAADLDEVTAGDAPASKGRSEAQVRAAQFPAKAGRADLEVDGRSPDGSEGMVHVKEFVLLGRAEGPIGDEVHAANAAVVAHEAVQRGLHPRGEASFEGAEDHADGRSVVLRYSVPVVPSSVDRHAQDTVTPRAVLAAGQGATKGPGV